MGNTGLAQLGSLRIQAQQRSDNVNSGFLTTPEWNQLLTSSHKELYDLLITSYGDDYNVALPYCFQTVSGTQLYALPDGLTTVDSVTGATAVPLYKLLGVDLRVTSSPDSWLTLIPFQFTERNRFWLANQQSVYGGVALRYRIVGSNLWVTPTSTVQTIQLWYIPKPTNLMPVVTCGTTLSSAVVTTPDTSQLAVGMSVADLVLPQGATQVVPDNTTISSISPGVSFTMSAVAAATKAGYLLGCWSDGTTIDGVSGWEEYVVVDAALKALIKEESSNVQELMAEKAALKLRIIETAAGRDASIPARVSDSTSTQTGWPNFDGSGDGGW